MDQCARTAADESRKWCGQRAQHSKRKWTSRCCQSTEDFALPAPSPPSPPTGAKYCRPGLPKYGRGRGYSSLSTHGRRPVWSACCLPSPQVEGRLAAFGDRRLLGLRKQLGLTALSPRRRPLRFRSGSPSSRSGRTTWTSAASTSDAPLRVARRRPYSARSLLLRRRCQLRLRSAPTALEVRRLSGPELKRFQRHGALRRGRPSAHGAATSTPRAVRCRESRWYEYKKQAHEGVDALRRGRLAWPSKGLMLHE